MHISNSSSRYENLELDNIIPVNFFFNKENAKPRNVTSQRCKHLGYLVKDGANERNIDQDLNREEDWRSLAKISANLKDTSEEVQLNLIFLKPWKYLNLASGAITV